MALATAITMAVVPAVAAAKPRVTFSFVASADAGRPVQFNYSAKGLPANAKLVLQRQQGTAHVWRTIKTLRRSANGSSTVPAYPLGRYRLRLAALKKRSVVAAQTRQLSVFGTVPFKTLFGRTEQAYTTGGAIFRFVFGVYAVASGSSRSGTLVTVDKNPCRSVHVDFIPGSDRGTEIIEGSGTASIVQESRDAVSATVPAQTVGEVDAVVTPGQAWSINVQDVGSRVLTWYVNGSASCYATTLAD
jgi:hypothetical protein